MNANSSLLSLMIKHFLELMCSLAMRITIVKEAWSDKSYQSGWIKWLSNLLELLWRNIRLMTKLESCLLSKYLVGTWLVGFDSSNLNESAIIRKSSLIEEWWGNNRSYKLLWMLKLPVIIRRFVICKSTCPEIHPRGGVTFKSYKPAFHGGHFSCNMSHGSAATLQIFCLLWRRYCYSTWSSMIELLLSVSQHWNLCSGFIGFWQVHITKLIAEVSTLCACPSQLHGLSSSSANRA